MVVYLLKRLAQAVPLVLGVTVLIFVILQMAPGGPLATGESGAATLSAEQRDRLESLYGLDDPLPAQYLTWASGVFTGDWGFSFASGEPVLAVIADRVPVTITLTLSAFVISCLLSVPLGIWAATRKGSWLDHVVTGVSFAGLATPSFWFALMLVFVFSYGLGWLPAYGLYDLRHNYEGMAAAWDYARHLIMPVGVVALIATANLTRYVRSAMLEVLDQDYVRTARGSGLPERTVVTTHAFKNAAIPVVTVAVLTIPELFLGTVIVETIFALPGMGRLFIDSAGVRDYPVLMGILLVGALLVIVANLVADLLYGWLDPRIRYD